METLAMLELCGVRLPIKITCLISPTKATHPWPCWTRPPDDPHFLPPLPPNLSTPTIRHGTHPQTAQITSCRKYPVTPAPDDSPMQHLGLQVVGKAVRPAPIRVVNKPEGRMPASLRARRGEGSAESARRKEWHGATVPVHVQDAAGDEGRYCHHPERKVSFERQGVGVRP